MTKPRLKLEMTFRHLNDLESLVGTVRRCAATLEGADIEGARCSVYLAPRDPRSAPYDAEARLVTREIFAIERGTADCPYRAIEVAFERLGQRLEDGPPTEIPRSRPNTAA